MIRLATATAASMAAPVIIPASARGAEGRAAPSERITLGFIGVGSHGVSMNLNSFLPQPDAQVLMVCDVDGNRVKAAAERVRSHYAGQNASGRAALIDMGRDFREVITRPDLDGVVISTPDHWHVIPAVLAAREGKDVFCEKPLSLTVQEGRILSDTINRYGRVFQTASENRSKWNFLHACELVRNGRIGKLHTIRTVLPQGFRLPIQPELPVPEDLDWDMWLGQAPWRPYCNWGMERCHYQWRWNLDFSGGQLTDWGAHINDVAQWGNDTEYTGPVSVEGWGDFPPDGLYNAAVDFEVSYEYANGVRLICKSGTPGIRFEGSAGWIECKWDSFACHPESLQTEKIGPEEIHLRTCPEREQRDFLNCVKSRAKTYYPVEVGHRSVSVCHIGNIAMKLGRKLHWDPDRERFVNDPEADRYLSRAMREPWTL